MMDDIKAIIDQIEKILQNPDNKPNDLLGSYIVGATLARGDYKILSKKYPLIEEIAELGADLETLAGHSEAENILKEVSHKLSLLKKLVE